MLTDFEIWRKRRSHTRDTARTNITMCVPDLAAAPSFPVVRPPFASLPSLPFLRPSPVLAQPRPFLSFCLLSGLKRQLHLPDCARFALASLCVRSSRSYCAWRGCVAPAQVRQSSKGDFCVQEPQSNRATWRCVSLAAICFRRLCGLPRHARVSPACTTYISLSPSHNRNHRRRHHRALDLLLMSRSNSSL